MCLSSLLTKQKLVLVVTISVVCGACFCIINYSVPAPWPPRPDDSWSLSLRSPGAVPELHGGPEPGAGPRMMVVGGARVSCFRRSETWLGWCVVLWWMLTAADIFSSHLRSLAVSLKLTGFWMSSLYFYLKPSMHDFKGIGVYQCIRNALDWLGHETDQRELHISQARRDWLTYSGLRTR